MKRLTCIVIAIVLLLAQCAYADESVDAYFKRCGKRYTVKEGYLFKLSLNGEKNNKTITCISYDNGRGGYIAYTPDISDINAACYVIEYYNNPQLYDAFKPLFYDYQFDIAYTIVQCKSYFLYYGDYSTGEIATLTVAYNNLFVGDKDARKALITNSKHDFTIAYDVLSEIDKGAKY